MSEPLRARRDEEPRPDPALYEQVIGDGDRTGRPAPQAVTPPTWETPPASPDDDHAVGRRRALHAVIDARPAPEPVNPAALRTPREPVKQLTMDEISYFLARDPDKFAEEDFYRYVRFDRAIDREPELE